MRESYRNSRLLNFILCIILLSGSISFNGWSRNYQPQLKQFLNETHRIYRIDRRTTDTSANAQLSARLDSTITRLQTTALPDSTIIATLYDIAVKLSENGLYNATIEYTKLARRFLQDNFPEQIAQKETRVNLALIQASAYQALGMSTPAINLYFNSLEETKKDHLDAMTAIIYNNLGSSFQRQKEYAQADTFFNKAIQINEARKDKQKLFVNYNNLAVTYAKQNNHDKALEYAFLALHQLDSKKDKDMIMLMQQSIASIYLNRTEEALTALQKAKQQADICHSEKDQVGLLNSFAEIYAEKREFGKAYDCLSSAVAIKDSLSEIENKYQFANIEEMYLTGQKRNLHEALASRHERKRNAVIYTLLGIVIASLLTALLRNRIASARKRAAKEESWQEAHRKFDIELREKEREKAQLEQRITAQKEQLLQQEKEMTSLSIQSVQNENYIEKLNEEMKKLLLEINVKESEKRKHIKEIISKINQYNTKNGWDEFRFRFENVHDSFFQKLSERYPDLTTNDQHLCALLRLGLSTKEIAAITFKEVRSIESGRNRLRKKLGLSEKEDLAKFLAEF